MSINHEIRLKALEDRLSTIESVLESLAGEFQAFASGSVPVKEIATSELPSASEGMSGFQVTRRPGRGPARYNVEQAGVPINTNPLTLQEAEELAGRSNEAVEPLETA